MHKVLGLIPIIKQHCTNPVSVKEVDLWLDVWGFVLVFNMILPLLIPLSGEVFTEYRRCCVGLFL